MQLRYSLYEEAYYNSLYQFAYWVRDVESGVVSLDVCRVDHGNFSVAVNVTAQEDILFRCAV